MAIEDFAEFERLNAVEREAFAQMQRTTVGAGAYVGCSDAEYEMACAEHEKAERAVADFFRRQFPKI